eukprot:TRINITY_DN36042_c0_g1_i1.p1 TRINITY_DN36042_c0_g1~~TRINITY_DN36042_c0_g1_i1.p1  ORF type:complete len:174 (-),score=50.40 TRINITY_DN36042_c0_g1_i1:4-462(-)
MGEEVTPTSIAGVDVDDVLDAMVDENIRLVLEWYQSKASAESDNSDETVEKRKEHILSLRKETENTATADLFSIIKPPLSTTAIMFDKTMTSALINDDKTQAAIERRCILKSDELKRAVKGKTEEQYLKEKWSEWSQVESSDDENDDKHQKQ